MGKKLGLNCKLYRNTGTYASPVWNEVPNVRDLTLSNEKERADLTTRGNNGYKAEAGTLKTLEIEFEMIYDNEDLDFVALQSAYDSNSAVEVAVMDGDITTTGNKGLRATCEVFRFGENQELTEGVKVPVLLALAYSANPPVRYTVP